MKTDIILQVFEDQTEIYRLGIYTRKEDNSKVELSAINLFKNYKGAIIKNNTVIIKSNKIQSAMEFLRKKFEFNVYLRIEK